MDRVKKLGQYFTGKEQCEKAQSFITNKRAKILDPCAGNGNLLVGFENITAVEIDKYFCDELKERLPHCKVYNEDFLNWQTSETFDYVIMNPPYTRSMFPLIDKALTLAPEVIMILPTSKAVQRWNKYQLDELYLYDKNHFKGKGASVYTCICRCSKKPFTHSLFVKQELKLVSPCLTGKLGDYLTAITVKRPYLKDADKTGSKYPVFNNTKKDEPMYYTDEPLCAFDNDMLIVNQGASFNVFKAKQFTATQNMGIYESDHADELFEILRGNKQCIESHCFHGCGIKHLDKSLFLDIQLVSSN